MILNYFELVGLLLRKGTLDPEMITSEFSLWAYSYWIASEKYIEKTRQRDSNYWINYEKLMQAMDATNEKVYRDTSYRPTKAEVKNFLEGESKLVFSA